VLRLVTIPISHYCEKARWALDRAGIEYFEERHVQALHRIASRRAGGKGTVPVLVTPEGTLCESEQILLYADQRTDDEERRLFPREPALREEIMRVSRWLDQGLGPDGRRLVYALMLPHKAAMLRFNNRVCRPGRATS
jgi:glutathione S-transferase